MFANCQLGGLNFGFPDVCLTPTPAGPVPIPYPNLAPGMTANPATACKKIYLSCMPAHNLATTGTISQGDNSGVNMGVASGMVMGPHRHIMGSFGVIYEGTPATKMTSLTGQNGMSMNAPGMTLVPAQFKVLIMK
ncbi:MAG: DUF4150 domain-containing protein [Desulfobacterales bacterium]|nr:MAG: DUF4150 domain-containing protein [Desulfobacterales bacterium]